MLQTILAISGKPGLYKLISRGKMNLIVEKLDDSHKRMPAFATDRITSLGDIAIYTEEEDIPLAEVLEKVKQHEDGKPCQLDYKKCSSAELHNYFTEILPAYDKERVHDSDIKKLLQWYNILINAGVSTFVEAKDKGNEENQ